MNAIIPRMNHNSTEETQRAEVPISNPDLARLHTVQHVRQERAFLSVCILAGNDVDHQSPVGIEHRQRLSGQRNCGLTTQHVQAVFRRGKVVSIKQPDLVPRQQRWIHGSEFLQHRQKLLSRIHDQGRRDLRLDTIQLVVESLS